MWRLPPPAAPGGRGAPGLALRGVEAGAAPTRTPAWGNRPAPEPLRERVHELLMLALYRSGQQAAALAAYRNTRRQLVGELGIEPGPALRELNLRIQRADPSLLLPGTRERAAGGTRSSDAALRPRMLPGAVPGFIGRAAELAAVSALMPEPPDGDGAAPITVISGTAGVGKTALAVHWAHQHAGGFSGGQLYVNLRR